MDGLDGGSKHRVLAWNLEPGFADGRNATYSGVEVADMSNVEPEPGHLVILLHFVYPSFSALPILHLTEWQDWGKRNQWAVVHCGLICR